VLSNRWLRWGLFGFGAAYLVREWGGSMRPYWALGPSFLLVWVLLESVYTWLAVRALSLSSIPVYPTYRTTTNEVNWPVAKEYLHVKKQIKDLGFVRQEKLSADLGGQLSMFALLYLEKTKNIRLQVIFAPRASGLPALFFLFSSKQEDNRWLTDNVWLPFGGVFPSEWKVDRRPFISSPKTLLSRHLRNISKSESSLEEFSEEDLLDELNGEQEILDRESTEKGILMPKSQRPEYGKLTGEGRYRVWKQILLLNYFGKVGQKDNG
jgi:hypothetical protein